MTKVIDLRLDFPPSVDEIVAALKFVVLNRDGRGVANYRRIFGPRWVAATGVSLEELEKMADRLSEEKLDAFLREKGRKLRSACLNSKSSSMKPVSSGACCRPLTMRPWPGRSPGCRAGFLATRQWIPSG